MALLVYKCRQDVAPPYLADELCRPADTEARCRLRSASASSLIVRRTRLSTVGDRAFPVAAPRIWNSLPQHVTSAPSLAIFHSRLNTHLFGRCFPWLHRSLVVPEKWHVITDTLIVFVTYLLTYLLTTHLWNNNFQTHLSNGLWGFGLLNDHQGADGIAPLCVWQRCPTVIPGH